MSELVKDNVPISESIIKQIHYLVLAVKKEDRGVYRRVPVHIMGVQCEPVQPYLIESKMEQLLYDFAESTKHIVTKLARFHIEFEGIRPFIDGNGRTGRLLVNFLQWKICLQDTSMQGWICCRTNRINYEMATL